MRGVRRRDARRSCADACCGGEAAPTHALVCVMHVCGGGRPARAAAGPTGRAARIGAEMHDDRRQEAGTIISSSIHQIKFLTLLDERSRNPDQPSAISHAIGAARLLRASAVGGPQPLRETPPNKRESQSRSSCRSTETSQYVIADQMHAAACLSKDDDERIPSILTILGSWTDLINKIRYICRFWTKNLGGWSAGPSAQDCFLVIDTRR
ncbi:hypothetical protein GUJ93_ZPchr0002g25600 [Zizania palustris]|uniref:Uncharacterized protein n=1 Tax=Zizania palustris TaxID=103762 RepID=A0A8J5VBK9_ZIZPA|nr:hypothetical protein GUJ93_ZPchr0002g25600 [Zizania palustris]